MRIFFVPLVPFFLFFVHPTKLLYSSHSLVTRPPPQTIMSSYEHVVKGGLKFKGGGALPVTGGGVGKKKKKKSKTKDKEVSRGYKRGGVPLSACSLS